MSSTRPPDGSPASSRPRAVVSWSSGKDAALALHEVQRSNQVDVVGLLTTITETFDRVSMHGVRRAILEEQARAAGLPLFCVSIPSPCPNPVYEQRMAEALDRLRTLGVSRIVFGDLFLEDVRAYREQRMRGTGIVPLFPLWGRPTAALAAEILACGIEAVLVTVDPRRVPKALAGRSFDDGLLADLPSGVDPCGENGEFHTCVTAGPMFRWRIPVERGAVVERDGFVFADLTLAPRRGSTQGGP